MKNYQKPDKKRNAQIIHLKEINGWSFNKIATRTNVTPQRCQQIYKRYLELKKAEEDKVTK